MSTLIRNARTRHDVSVRDLALALGVAPSTVQSYERSELRETIQIATLRRALAALGEELIAESRRVHEPPRGFVKPYAVVELARLKGPDKGIVELPKRLYWQPGGPAFDLRSPGRWMQMASAVLDSGTADDISRLINRDLLIEHWDTMAVATRARARWEQLNPELARAQ